MKRTLRKFVIEAGSNHAKEVTFAEYVRYLISCAASWRAKGEYGQSERILARAKNLRKWA